MAVDTGIYLLFKRTNVHLITKDISNSMARIKGSIGHKTALRILDESLALIAKFGYAAVSMRMIAEAVGVNVGSLYNHFANKQQILVRLMSDHMNSLLKAWDEVDVDNLNSAERLDRFVRFHISYNLPRADAVFISFMELRSLAPENHEKIENLRRKYEDIVRNIINEGQQQGLFKIEDAHVAAMSVLGSVIGVNTWYREKGRLSKSKIEDHYVAMTLRSVGYVKSGDQHV